MSRVPPASRGNTLPRDARRGSLPALRALYILGCLGLLGLAWVWAHDNAPRASLSNLTPRSAGPLIGQQSPTWPAAPTQSPLPTPPPPRPSQTAAPSAPGPPTPPATPWPPAAVITPDANGHTFIIQDRNFTGGSSPPEGLYRDRTARLISGQADPISAQSVVSAPFNLNLAADGPVREATLTVIGLGSPLSPAPRLRVELNGVVVYEGASPFPPDDGAGQDRPAQWTGVSWTVPVTAFRQGGNAAVITSLDATPTHFIAVDYVILVWKR